MRSRAVARARHAPPAPAPLARVAPPARPAFGPRFEAIPVRPPEGPPIQRLSFDNTEWDQATSATITGAGATGVAIVKGKPPPVVVKPGGGFAVESVVAGALMGGVLGAPSQAGQGIRGDTPQVRVAAEGERAGILEAVSLGAGDKRGLKFLDKLEGGPILVFSFATGEDFTALINQRAVKNTRKGMLDKTRALRSNTPLTRMLGGEGVVAQLGRVSAVDIFTGNGDRLLDQLNAGNFKVDMAKGTLTAIDNVHEQSHARLVASKFGTQATSYGHWADKRWVAPFVAGDLGPIAASAVAGLVDGIKTYGSFRKKDEPLLMQALDGAAGRWIKAFHDGLAEGREAVLARLAEPAALVAGVPDDQRAEALTGVRARAASLMAGKLLPWDEAIAED